MADMAIVNSKIAALNADQALTFTAADVDSANGTQKFVYTPTGKDNKIVIGIKNATGVLTWVIGAGVGVFGAAAKSSSTAADKTDIIQIETGKYMKANGTIEITFTPESGTKLLTNHALSVFVIELQ